MRIFNHLSLQINRLFKFLAFPATRCMTAVWPPYSRLILVKDKAGWVIDEEMRELDRIAVRLRIRQADSRWLNTLKQQAVFYGSQFFLLSDEWLKSSHRIGMAYFHGKPCTGISEFDKLYRCVVRYHERIARIQVSHREMYECLLTTGIFPEKMHLIPIGINTTYFNVQKMESKRLARKNYDIPQTAIAIGSFQKDGVGWGEGKRPKLIKGPDVFIKTIKQLKKQLPEIFIVLSGPSRGYVKEELDKLNIPYRHFLLKNYAEVGQLFQVLDLYLVTSRQEGGPKSILESMASGVPIVTTRVGQAMDLVKHGKNGFMVDIEDTEGLAYWSKWVFDHPSDMKSILIEGRKTAEENTYDMQLPLWREFMKGFVKVPN
jgi:glycosyltransferase involved in cell wall biosynthesis